ncbi:hypothetical protein [Telmatospirillum sp.]|uniref:hypothetical protein n=1 Tax=Telmatospirillum sp. TaxID=2079197 RepID=UPI002852A9C2|nr:hypothetical protein [Telmatospirillum sp.]
MIEGGLAENTSYNNTTIPNLANQYRSTLLVAGMTEGDIQRWHWCWSGPGVADQPVLKVIVLSGLFVPVPQPNTAGHSLDITTRNCIGVQDGLIFPAGRAQYQAIFGPFYRVMVYLA